MEGGALPLASEAVGLRLGVEVRSLVSVGAHLAFG